MFLCVDVHFNDIQLVLAKFKNLTFIEQNDCTCTDGTITCHQSSLWPQTFPALLVGSPLLVRWGTYLVCRCIDLLVTEVICCRVRSATRSWTNDPIRSTRSPWLPQRRPTCLTWTAFCPTSPTPCSPWHRNHAPGPVTATTAVSLHSQWCSALMFVSSVESKDWKCLKTEMKTSLNNWKLIYLLRIYITPLS